MADRQERRDGRRLRSYETVSRKFRGHPLRFVALLLVSLYIICVLTVMISEHLAFPQAVLVLMPSVFGELGDVEATPADVAAVLSLAVYALLLAMIFERVGKLVVERALKGGIPVKRIRHKGHVLICGWNSQGSRIVDNLLNSDFCKKRAVCILADTEKKPVNKDAVEFEVGSPSRKEDLERANIKSAECAIILPPDGITITEGNSQDAESLMMTLAVENLTEGEIHSVVQLHSSENREHLVRAGADDVICLDQVGGSLAVSCASNPGLSEVICELLTFNKGSEFYKCRSDLVAAHAGKTFTQLAKELLDKKTILIAVETDNDARAVELKKTDLVHEIRGNKCKRLLIINPQGEYTIKQKDCLFVIAEKPPKAL